jgi:hypothetical protein
MCKAQSSFQMDLYESAFQETPLLARCELVKSAVDRLQIECICTQPMLKTSGGCGY